MDLQLFGGGGGGKSAGKILGSIAFGFISAGFSFFGGGLSAIARFAMGASLFSSVWSATHPQELSTASLDVTRFDREQETMTSTAQLPVVYGMRKITGNQTFHDTNADANTLHKHVVLCEGGIEGITSVCANDLLIPTGSQTSGTVFTLQNLKYSDATVRLTSKHLIFTANGKTRDIYLCNKNDTSGSFYSYQISVQGLISYLNQLGEGWQAFPMATTNKYPGDLWIDTSQSWKYVDTVTINEEKTVGSTFDRNGYHYKVLSCTSQHYDDDDNGYDVYTTVCQRYVDTSSNAYGNTVGLCADTVVGGTTYTYHDSTPPDNYTETGAYTDMAWLDMHFVVSSELNGNPSVSCVVKGRKVYDTRTKTTAYSTNPAMCLRDFLLSPRYGLGKWFTAADLEDDSWNEAADYCDEVITFHDSDGVTVKAKRYELNMVIDQQKSALEWLQAILANFAGFIVYSNGKLKLCIEKPTVTSYKFNDDNCSDLKIEPLKLEETPNRYEISLVDPLNNWSSIKAICEDYADQKLRQRIITKSVSLEGVTSQNQALRLARFYRDYNLTCPLQVSFVTGMQGMSLEPGDVVTLKYHGVFDGLPIRIASIKETNKGTFEISGRQYNETIYGDDLGGGIHWYNYATMPTPYAGAIPDVYNYEVSQEYYVQRDGTSVSRVNLSYTLPRCSYFSHTMIDYSMDNGTTWVVAGESYSTTFAFPVIVGQTYLVRTRVVNTVGRMSNGVTSSAMYITGKNNPPSDVSAFDVVQSGESMVAIITEVTDKDLDHYEIRQGTSWERSVLIGTFTGNRFTFPATQDGTITYFCKAVDNCGNYSVKAKKSIVNVSNLPERNVILTDDVSMDKWTITSMDKRGSAYCIADKKVIGDYAYFSDIFDEVPLKKADASIVLPVIDLGENMLDNSCFWKDADGVMHLKETKVINDYTYFSDIFTDPVKYQSMKYQNSTFLSVNVNAYIDGSAKYEVFYRTSVDGSSWSVWIPENVKQFAGRYVEIKIVPTSIDDVGNVFISAISVIIDVPDIEESIENVVFTAAKKTIKFNNKYVEVKSISAYTQDTSGKQATCFMDNQTSTSVDVGILDDNGAYEAGLLQKLTIRGY